MTATWNQIHSVADFEELLRSEAALLLICFREREPALQTIQLLEKSKGAWPVYLLYPNDVPGLWKWVNELFEPADDEAQPGDALVWLKKGEALDCEADLQRAGGELLARISHDCFVLGKKRALNAPREMAPFDAGLLSILCCPESHQPLSLAEPAVLQTLNQRIEAGALRNRAGTALKEKLSGGLLRADGAVVYPLRHNIPILLVEEGIAV